MSMNKHSKYRPILDKVQIQIMKAEIGVTGVYQVMLEALDEAETAEAALREELAALRSSLGSLGIHNLKQGIMLSQMGVEPEDLAKVSINKVRADAVRSVTEQGFEYSVEHGPWDNDWVISQYVINDYANKIEAGL